MGEISKGFWVCDVAHAKCPKNSSLNYNINGSQDVHTTVTGHSFVRVFIVHLLYAKHCSKAPHGQWQM